MRSAEVGVRSAEVGALPTCMNVQFSVRSSVQRCVQGRSYGFVNPCDDIRRGRRGGVVGTRPLAPPGGRGSPEGRRRVSPGCRQGAAGAAEDIPQRHKSQRPMQNFHQMSGGDRKAYRMSRCRMIVCTAGEVEAATIEAVTKGTVEGFPACTDQSTRSSRASRAVRWAPTCADVCSPVRAENGVTDGIA